MKIQRSTRWARRSVALFVPLAVAFSACVSDDNVITDGGAADADAGCAKECNETCVSGSDPATGCGGASCAPCPAGPNQTASCNAGACGVACSAGFADCDKTAPGCETNVGTDVANCGKCGNACGTANTTAVACGSATGDAGAGDASADAGAPQSGVCVFTCSGAYAHCGTDDSTGCETNIGTDANNCGACGHSCGGGTCVGGYCQPVILAGDPANDTGLNETTHYAWGTSLINLGGYLYGTNWYGSGGELWKVSTTPGNALQWLVGGATDAGAAKSGSGAVLATDGTSITYAIEHVNDPKGEGAGIWNVQTDGSNNKVVVSGGTTGGGPACNLSTAYGYEVEGLAFDSSYIYWTRDTYNACFPSTPGCYCQGIYRANADGTNVTQFFTSTWYTAPLADSGTLYMVDYFGAKVVVATSQTFTNNTPPTAIPTSGTPTSIQTDSNYVYWLDQAAKHFHRAKKIGATTSDDITPTSGMPSGSLWSGFLVDAKNIYFVSPDDNPNNSVTQQIYVMPKDGSGPAMAIPGAIISSQGDSISAWTEDAGALYWATLGFDPYPSAPYTAVYKLAKP